MGTPVKAKHSGSKEAVLAFARSRKSKNYEEVVSFVDQLYAQNIFDAFMIAAQSANETTNWTDNAWRDRLNPGGIGITPNHDFGYGFESGADAAKAMLVHHAAYTGTAIPKAWIDWIVLDPRYKAVFDAGYNGKITNWEDYGKGYWATDPHYFEAIRDRAKAIRAFEGTETTTTTPKPQGGKMPTILDRWLHVAQLGYSAVNRRYINRGGMSPKVIVVHIQEGSNLGSWQWFHVVKASCTVLIGKNGDIWRLVPEQDAPWTNGDVKSPTTKGRQLINTYGADPNYYSLTIETEGFTGEWPKTGKQLESVLWQIREWMSKYNIPLERVIRHADINQIDKKRCPGDDYYNYLLQELLDTPTKPQEPTYAKPEPIIVKDNITWKGTKDFTRKSDGTIFHADIREVEAIKEGAVRVFATKNSATTRKNLAVGEKFSVLGWVAGENVGGENRWWITKYYSRVWVGNTKQKPQEDVPIDDDNEENQGEDAFANVRIHNGRAYYPTLENGNPRIIKTDEDTPIYKSATTRSKKVGELKKGEEREVTHFVFGDEVDDEPMWWVLKAGDADSITQGGRVPASATYERPE